MRRAIRHIDIQDIPNKCAAFILTNPHYVVGILPALNISYQTSNPIRRKQLLVEGTLPECDFRLRSDDDPYLPHFFLLAQVTTVIDDVHIAHGSEERGIDHIAYGDRRRNITGHWSDFKAINPSI
ncbi:unnamed protein product [Rotaria sp. Silwood2]|nr:unnamed protein product [Rotaria sp. Silwood2]CAF3941544.1 unnamed protein product [Rotaria sp. Silwood2]